MVLGVSRARLRWLRARHRQPCWSNHDGLAVTSRWQVDSRCRHRRLRRSRDSGHLLVVALGSVAVGRQSRDPPRPVGRQGTESALGTPAAARRSAGRRYEGPRAGWAVLCGTTGAVKICASPSPSDGCGSAGVRGIAAWEPSGSDPCQRVTLEVLPHVVTFRMPKVRRGGYIFLSWIGDHSPKHVHVYRDGKLVVKWDLDNWQPMKGKASNRMLKLLRELADEGQV